LLLALFPKNQYNDLETIVLILHPGGTSFPKGVGQHMGTEGVIRTILLVDIVALALLSLIFLRQRRMDWISFCFWGLLALLVPVLGPFLVIANRPGEWNPSFTWTSDFRRFAGWVQRLLPTPPSPKKLGTLDRARMRKRKQQNQYAQAAWHEKDKLRKK
jgi:hypothetical protein